VAKAVYLKEREGEHRSRALRDADVVLSESFSSKEVPREDIPALTRLSFIQLIYAGADHVPFGLLPESIVIASNTGVFAERIAEHVMGMTLALAKNLIPKHLSLKQGVFEQAVSNTYLKGKVCGIVGFGGNGIAVAGIMRAFGMKIHAVNFRTPPAIEVDYFGLAQQGLRDVLRASDVVVLTVPLNRRTQGMIDRNALLMMKPDAILINVARGAVIEQKALYDHLKENPQFRAGIDTWWEEPGSHGAFRVKYPFFDLPNLIGSPHNADAVPGMNLEATRRAIENIKQHLGGKAIRGILKRRDYSDAD
jgi:glycerate dehydrogenase